MQFNPAGLPSAFALLSGFFALLSLINGFRKKKGFKRNLPFLLAYLSVSFNLFALALK